MVKFKKLLAAAMTGAMLLGVTAVAAVPAVSVYAAEDGVSEYEISIDYYNYTATISSTTKQDPYVILEVLKDSSGSKVNGTYTYEMNGSSSITIDLSFLKASKEAYLRVHGSSETVTSKITTVNKMPDKISLKYVAGQYNKDKSNEENLATAFSGGKTKVSKEDIENGLYWYRGLYGTEFRDLDDFEQVKTEMAGTTIVVRKQPDSDQTTGAPASAEVKVKIAAAPKMPKVTLDYAKGTIKLPKKTEAQIVYASEGAATVAASETIVLVDGMGTLYGSTDGSTFDAVTNENLSTYFEIKEGTIAVKTGCTFASDSDGSTEVTGDTALTYVKKEDTTSTSSGSNVTEWKDCTATSASPEDILKWFFTDQDKVDDLVESGFTLVVRTTATGNKAASNANILVIEGAAQPIYTEGATQLTVEGATLKWTTVSNGIKYEGTGFEYYDTAKSKWVAIKSGSTVKTAVTADVKVKVRKAGAKSTAAMPSASIEITVPKYVDTSSTTTPDPEKPTAPTVEKVEVAMALSDGTAVSGTITKGSTATCTATVTGSEGVDTGVTWKLEVYDGEDLQETGYSSAIQDNEDGTATLTVDNGDTGLTLKITATSKADNTKSASVSVEVTR